MPKIKTASKCSRRRTKHRKTTRLRIQQKLLYSRKEFQKHKVYSISNSTIRCTELQREQRRSVWKRFGVTRTEEEIHLIDMKMNLLYDNSAYVSFSLLLLKRDRCPNVCTVHLKISVCKMNLLRLINAFPFL